MEGLRGQVATMEATAVMELAEDLVILVFHQILVGRAVTEDSAVVVAVARLANSKPGAAEMVASAAAAAAVRAVRRAARAGAGANLAVMAPQG